MIPSRIKRVEEAVKEQIALILQQEVKDPRLNFVTVTAVHVSKDTRNADVFVTAHDESETNIKNILTALESASGFIRRKLGERVTLRLLPALKFHYDKTLSEGMRIDALLHQLEKEETSDGKRNQEEP
ncbi:MAG TPA: 30S ribosome-binding factor RbfA [Candidatus Sumerlaeota bacterium]|nr:30S ribosome-binding factor RbfA [Candidatus Sumerlaeota bacterium]